MYFLENKSKLYHKGYSIAWGIIGSPSSTSFDPWKDIGGCIDVNPSGSVLLLAGVIERCSTTTNHMITASDLLYQMGASWASCPA